MIRYAVTVFLSAFLLFQVQPLIGKYILPWFGGGPSVWTTCLLFFQVLLLGGYTYAHVLSSRLRPRLQVLLHVLLLALSVLVLPIIPEADTWKPTDAGAPTVRILLLLLVTVGPPYLLLSSTGPLLQRWFHDRFPGSSPYRLYALSNAGSLLALLSYPVVFEPWIDVDRQAWAWSAAYVFFALGTFLCGAPALRRPSGATSPEAGTSERVDPDSRTPRARARVTPGRILLWLALAASASAMLMATTNQISQEVSVVPFLWVVPLSIYLISFIITFDNPRRYDRRFYGSLLVGAAILSVIVLGKGRHGSLLTQLVSLNLALFACCMTCHGELVRMRPDPRRLTLFYLMVSLGGALGGLFVAVVAPMLFRGFWEFHVALAASATFTLVVWVLDDFGGRPRRSLILGVPLFAGLLGLFLVLVQRVREDTYWHIEVKRNFYGVLRITESMDDIDVYREMEHGQTSHGYQYLSDSLRTEPTSYYYPDNGIGLALIYHPGRYTPDPSLRIGVAGLGVGTLACYTEAGDTLRFYEINHDVIEAADTYFTYLADAEGEIEIVEGDARLMMEQELAEGHPGRFDALILDAFSSDSVPAHLLTAEAADIYFRHLAPGGILILHLSNQYLDLIPVGLGIARHLGLEPVLVTNEGNEAIGQDASDWLILTANRRVLERSEIREAASALPGEAILWTDKYASLWRVVQF